MRKYFLWIIALCIVILGVYFFETMQSVPVVMADESTNQLYIQIGSEKILSQTINGQQYFFCPSYASAAFDSKGVTVMKSQHINTIYIDTASLSMDYIWQDKNNKETASIRIYDPNGILVYNDDLEYIKGRGNSTWEADKKPYSIKLKDKTSLLGMSESKKWKLIANAYDQTLFANHMAFDMARHIGLEVTADAAYADLYLNGEYMGNYLLVSAITGENLGGRYQNLEKANENLNDVANAFQMETDTYRALMLNNPANITGTYIIEKDAYGRFATESSAFRTEDLNTFIIKEPEGASCEEVMYIQGICQNIETLLKSGSKEVFNYLDPESTAICYLVDTAMGNGDQGIASMYFYKHPDDEKLYSGPIWDYDRAFGMQDGLVYEAGKELSHFRSMIMCTWIGYLEQYDEFNQYCARIYRERLRDYLINLIENDIDEYSGILAASSAMNNTLWPSGEVYYNNPNTTIRYVKYYLIERIKLLDAKYGVTGVVPEFVGTGKTHTITVKTETGSVDFYVLDGEFLTNLPDFDHNSYAGYVDEDSNIPFNTAMPVLEDMTLILSETLNF